jgi:plasmid stabilization system protein ParE
MDKLQRAGRDFLMRLIAKHGPRGAARVRRALADELEARSGAPRSCRTDVPRLIQVVAVDLNASPLSSGRRLSDNTGGT